MLCFGTLASRFSSLVLLPCHQSTGSCSSAQSLHPTHAPSTPVAVCPVIRHLTDFSQKGFTFLVLTTLSFLTTCLRWVHFRSSFGCPPAQGLALSFCSNAHHHGSLPQQLGVVCDLLLKAGPEGPTLIFHAALRHHLPLCVALLSICLCSTLKPRKVKVSGLPSPRRLRFSAARRPNSMSRVFSE